jgi:Cyclic nucleotide-binding domain
MEAASRLQRSRYRRGEVIVAEGETADRFYVITSGEAEVIQWTADRDAYIRTLQPGDFFGEVGLLTSDGRSATVRAVGNVTALTLDERAFNQLVRRSEPTAAGLAQLLQVRSVRVTPRGDAVPLPAWTKLTQRVFKHPRLRHYNRLIALVMAVNVVVLWYGLARGAWWSGTSQQLTSIALVAVTNFGLAIILRQQYVINFLCWLGTLPPTSWPLRLRWMFGKYYHFGGLHVGAAIAGTLWYVAFVGSLTYDLARGVDHVSVVNIAMSYAVVVLFVIIIVMALPHRRGAAHDKFEVTHRFCGWAALLLVSVDTVLFVVGQRGHSSVSSALLTAPTVWILLTTIVFVAWPWMLLRNVPIAVERPSEHAVVISLDHGGKPGVGTTRPISRKPFVGWHQFANLPPRVGSPGYRMVISRAGDWTGAFIDDPPERVWVRGIPTHSVANVGDLFTKMVYVTTGSGIGPVLPHILTRERPSQLVWVTRDPRETFGEALVTEIMDAQPDAVIWNTDQRGTRPDILRLAYAAYLESGAEAVLCISNDKITWQVVHGLERRGIPAFGPIWDS